MGYSIAFVFFISFISWVSNIHAAKTKASTTYGESYLYNTIDSPPVLDHGISNNNFLTSTKPKIVEFYDPKCGACQAFKSNYIEVAKKVQAEKPNVEFYGVSCEAYSDICEQYGEKRVPKIFAFASGGSKPLDGVQVEKGAGTIYFLSARLLKALRTPEEVALDLANNIESSTPKRNLRSIYDEDEDEDEEDEDESESEDDDKDESEDAEEDFWNIPAEDNSAEDNSVDVSELEDVPDDLKRLAHWREDEDDEEDSEEDSNDENSDEERYSQDGPSEDEVEDKHMAEETGSDEGNHTGEEDSDNDSAESNKDSDESQDNEQEESFSFNVRREVNPNPPLYTHDDYKNTDAYRNTMKHFHGLDKEKGKSRGHHWNEFQKEKERVGSRYDGNNDEPVQDKPTTTKTHPQTDQLPLTRLKKNIGVYGPSHDDGLERPPPPPPLPRSNLPVAFGNDPVRNKKYQEYIIRKKKLLARKEKIRHPLKTLIGRGNEHNEEEEMKASMVGLAHLEQKEMAFQKRDSPMANYKAQYKKQAALQRWGERKVPDLRPEAQHKSVGQKVLKKIPIVKRAFKRSKGEETLNDAALSFTRGLLMGVFKTNEALDYKKKQVLIDWLDLLRVSLPPEIALHELIDQLKGNIHEVAQRRENLVAIIDKHPLPDSKWSQDCTKGTSSGGFFCGTWKLFHVMSVGFAEQEGGLALRESSPSLRIFSAKEAADVLREYMAFFFNCDKCSKRFISKYDDCSFDRCHRLSAETEDASAESWLEFPLWIWQLHNDISRSKATRASTFLEKSGRREEAKRFEKSLSVVYPHLDECISCVTSEGSWNLNAVYRHLEMEYWYELFLCLLS